VFSFLTVNFSFMPWDFILILLVLGVLVPWRGAMRIKRLLAQSSLTSSERFSLYASTIAFQWFMVAIVAWRAFSRHLTPEELGLTVSAPWRTVAIAVILSALLCINQWASLRRLARLPEDQRGFMYRFTGRIMPHSSLEALAFTALACTAGLSEEFLYRGFLFAVFVRAFANSAFPVLIAAAVVSSALFAIGHLYQGWRGIITTLVVGILFCVVRIWSGNLVSPVAAHIAADLLAGLYAPRLFRAGCEVQAPTAAGNVVE
jgi:membrane protease YdiL (CAAX protease family)